MKVLVATREGQGSLETDYCRTVDGEPVYVQAEDCSRPECGCDRGFAGLSSSRATTTAQVVDRPDMSLADLKAALTDSLTRDGRGPSALGRRSDDRFVEGGGDAELAGPLLEVVAVELLGGSIRCFVRTRAASPGGAKRLRRRNSSSAVDP